MKVYVLTEEYSNDVRNEYESSQKYLRGVFDDRQKAIKEIETLISMRKQFVLEHFDEDVNVIVTQDDSAKDYGYYTEYCTFRYSRNCSPFCFFSKGADFWEFCVKEVEMNVGRHRDVEGEIREYIAEEEKWREE